MFIDFVWLFKYFSISLFLFIIKFVKGKSSRFYLFSSCFKVFFMFIRCSIRVILRFIRFFF